MQVQWRVTLTAAIAAVGILGCRDSTPPVQRGAHAIIAGDTITNVGKTVILVASAPSGAQPCENAEFTLSDSTIALPHHLGCRMDLLARHAGHLTVTAIVNGDTAHRGTHDITINAPAVRAIALRPQPAVSNGPTPIAVSVILYADVNPADPIDAQYAKGAARDRLPTATFADSTMARVSSIEAAPASDSAAAIVHVQPLRCRNWRARGHVRVYAHHGERQQQRRPDAMPRA